MKNEAQGVRRLIAATGFSLKGLYASYRSEAAFRQEVWAALILVPLGLWLGESALERALLIAAVLFVLIVELLNTAIEHVVDRVGEDFHELSGRAKDAGSAAVLVSIGLCIIVWAGVLLPH